MARWKPAGDQSRNSSWCGYSVTMSPGRPQAVGVHFD